MVDSSSDDATVIEATAAGARVMTIARSDFDHAGTRTLAAQSAAGQVLMFLTHDALPANGDAIANLVAALERDPQVGAAYGRQLSWPHTPPFAAHLRAFNYPSQGRTVTMDDRRTLGLRAAFLSDSFCAYRAEALARAGWFGHGLILGEDMVAGARLLKLGYRLCYEPGAEVYHAHAYTVAQEFRRYFDIGVMHADQRWLIDEFGRAEGEGLRYVRSEVAYLANRGLLYKVPEGMLRNVMKYMGYAIGQRYRLLPASMRRRLGMNQRWWDLQK